MELLISAAIAGDFTPLSGEQRTIEPSAPNQPVCVNISTMGNMTLESPIELFTVSLSSSDPGVLVNPAAANATVAIIDDDSE